MFGFSDAVQATVEELRAQKYGRLALVVRLALIQCMRLGAIVLGQFLVSRVCVSSVLVGRGLEILKFLCTSFMILVRLVEKGKKPSIK